MNAEIRAWASQLFMQSRQPSPLQGLVDKLPPAPPAPPSQRDQIIPPELAHEMALIDAYAANAEEYGYEANHTLESLKELVAHLSKLKKGGSA